MKARSMAPLMAALALEAGLWGTDLQAQAAPHELFKDADLRLGEQLIQEHKCSACHARREGGDGHSIYKPRGRINTPGLLRGMVQYCSTELNLGLFPEDVDAIAAVLQRDHYKFPASAR